MNLIKKLLKIKPTFSERLREFISHQESLSRGFKDEVQFYYHSTDNTYGFKLDVSPMQLLRDIESELSGDYYIEANEGFNKKKSFVYCNIDYRLLFAKAKKHPKDIYKKSIGRDVVRSRIQHVQFNLRRLSFNPLNEYLYLTFVSEEKDNILLEFRKGRATPWLIHAYKQESYEW